MSLINDALKRASQIDPAKAPAMEILEPVPSAPSSRLPLVVLPIIFVAALGLGVWFLLRGWQITRQTYHQAGATVAARGTPANSSPETTALPGSESAPAAPEPDVTAPVPARTGATIATSVPVEPAVEQVPAFPKLRLQAVFYRRNHPSVMVNNQSLWVGDKVENATVLAITPGSVVVEWNGERRELRVH